MTAYFMQELILEPYGGLVFGMSPGETTQMSGAQNGGAFLGMLAVGILASGLKLGSLRLWVVSGCLGSAAVLGVIALAPPGVPLVALVMALGFCNGMFAVAAIGSMMQLAGQGRGRREGTRMGLWGASQAIAAGAGGFLGAALVDVFRAGLPVHQAFGTVFLIEAALFLAAAAMALRIMSPVPQGTPHLVAGE
jgi:MFS transporter, BCD family, chlorophyll transporter